MSYRSESGPARYTSSALGVAWRYLHNLYTRPSMFIPSLVFPLFFLAAFAGGLSVVGDAPNFGYYDFTAFQFCFILIQASALAGVFAGFSIAGDFEPRQRPTALSHGVPRAAQTRHLSQC